MPINTRSIDPTFKNYEDIWPLRARVASKKGLYVSVILILIKYICLYAGQFRFKQWALYIWRYSCNYKYNVADKCTYNEKGERFKLWCAYICIFDNLLMYLFIFFVQVIAPPRCAAVHFNYIIHESDMSLTLKEIIMRIRILGDLILCTHLDPPIAPQCGKC